MPKRSLAALCLGLGVMFAASPRAESPKGTAPPDCPRPDSVATRNARLIVRYDGQTDRGACLERVGGAEETLLFGIWPSNWPEAGVAADAARRVLGAAVGTREDFSASFNWVGNSFSHARLGP